MYSPKIREDLIPLIYRVAKAAGVHMTTWVNTVLAKALSEIAIPQEPETKAYRKKWPGERKPRNGGQGTETAENEIDRKEVTGDATV